MKSSHFGFDVDNQFGVQSGEYPMQIFPTFLANQEQSRDADKLKCSINEPFMNSDSGLLVYKVDSSKPFCLSFWILFLISSCGSRLYSVSGPGKRSLCILQTSSLLKRKIP